MMLTDDLPYFCHPFRSGHLQSPCAGKLAKIQELQEKGQTYLGTLEKCQECQGSKLETRTMAEKELSEKGLEKIAGIAAIGEKRTLILDALDRVIKRDGQATRRSLAEELKVTVPTVVNWLKPMEGFYITITPGDGPTNPALIGFAGPKSNGELAAPAEVPKVLELPEVPEAEIVPEPPELPKVAEIPEVAAPLAPSYAVFPEPAPAALEKPYNAPICKEEGCEALAVIDSRGYNMKVCKKHLAERSKKNLAKGPQAAFGPFYIPLQDPRFKEIKDWIDVEAEELVQTPAQRVIYLLKMAHRAATKQKS